MPAPLAQPPACLTTAWTPVADRVSDGRWDRWAWRITTHERVMLELALAAGTALTAHRPTPSGPVLLARRCA